MLDCHWLIARDLCVYAGVYAAYKINPSPWNGTQTAIAYVCVDTRGDLRRSINHITLCTLVCAVRSAYYGVRSINPALRACRLKSSLRSRVSVLQRTKYKPGLMQAYTCTVRVPAIIEAHMLRTVNILGKLSKCINSWHFQAYRTLRYAQLKMAVNARRLINSRWPPRPDWNVGPTHVHTLMNYWQCLSWAYNGLYFSTSQYPKQDLYAQN